MLAAVHAEDGCDKFAWPITREQALFAIAEKHPIESSQSLAGLQLPSFAFTLALPGKETSFIMTPELGGVVHFPAPPKPGLYQITLAEEAWIDVIQGGRSLHAVGSTGRSDSPSVRKSVRFEIGTAPFVLQLSGATSRNITVAIHPVKKWVSPVPIKL